MFVLFSQRLLEVASDSTMQTKKCDSGVATVPELISLGPKPGPTSAAQKFHPVCAGKVSCFTRIMFRAVKVFWTLGGSQEHLQDSGRADRRHWRPTSPSKGLPSAGWRTELLCAGGIWGHLLLSPITLALGPRPPFPIWIMM